MEMSSKHETPVVEDSDPFFREDSVNEDAEQDFYDELLADMEKSDDEHMENSWWWFWALSVFLFILFVIVVLVLVLRLR